MHPVCTELIDEPWSGSVSQALLYSALIQITPHPLLVNLWIQTVFHLLCGEVQCATVNSSGLLTSLPGFNGVYWEVQLLLNNHVLHVFPAIPYLVFSSKCFLLNRQK